MIKPDNITKLDWELLEKKYPYNLKKIIKKINRGYPVQYLIGNVDFYGYKIIVNKNVFIPRVETELLVEKTLKIINKNNLHHQKIIDICTGSGCIAITISKELNKKIYGLEKSKKAIKVAKENKKLNNANVKLIKEDIFKLKTLEYDVLISNPPYVRKHSPVDIQTKHEPQMALYPADNELSYYEHILKIVKKDVLLIAFEIGHDQAKKIFKLIDKYLPSHEYKVEKDYSGKDRFIFIWK